MCECGARKIGRKSISNASVLVSCYVENGSEF